MQYLTKSMNEVRVDTKSEVDALHDRIFEQAANGDYVLVGWDESLKTKKALGEIIDEWYIVKYTLQFTSPKDPEKVFRLPQYERIDDTIAFGGGCDACE